MATFTEYVRLITDAHESMEAIAKLNEAIKKLRQEAHAPINIRIQDEFEKKIAGEKKASQARVQNIAEEEKALKKKLETYRAMNMNQGGSFNNPRDGVFGPIRPVINSELDKQIEATTKRLNELAIAKNKIKSVAQESGVDLPGSELNKLAGQTVANTERELIRLEKEKIALKKEEIALWVRQTQMTQKLKENNNSIEASAGAKAQIELEREAIRLEAERIRKINERNAQEEYGARYVIAEEKEKQRLIRETDRAREKAMRDEQRAQERVKRERETELASSRERGLRGWASEAYRDIRRNMAYGAINKGEQGIHSGFDAEVERSKEVEAQYQSGRTPAERAVIEKHAEGLSEKYVMLSKTEAMTLQRHAIGEVGTVEGGVKLADIAAPYVALRTAAIGAEGALAENQKMMKGINELNWTGKPELQAKLYDQMARMSQVEGANFDPGSLLKTLQVMGSGKFALQPEAITNIAPLIGIGEGAGRAGNEVGMLLKTLAFEGKSIDNSIGKSNHLKYIEGTELSNGKGGFNFQLAKDLASGTVEGIRDFNRIMDSAAKHAGVNTDDPLAFSQFLGHVIGNKSAKELAMWYHEKPDYVEKELRLYGQARGVEANAGIERRDIGTAIEGQKQKFNDASAAILEPWKPLMLQTLKLSTDALQWASKNPSKAVGIGAAGAAALGTYVFSNPGQAANTSAILANTGAVMANTAKRFRDDEAGALAGAGKSGGKLGKVARGALSVGEFALAAELSEQTGDGIAQVINTQADFSRQGITIADELFALTHSQKALIDRLQKAKDEGRLHLGAAQSKASDIKNYNVANQLAGMNDPLNERMKGRGLPAHISYHPSVLGSGNNDPDGGRGRGLPSYAAPHFVSGAYSGDWGSDHFRVNKSSSFGALDNPFGHDGIQNIAAKLDAPTHEFADAIHAGSKLAADAFSSAGGILKGGMDVAASALSSAGGAVVSALHSVASEIASVHISSPSATPSSSNPGRQSPGPS